MSATAQRPKFSDVESSHEDSFYSCKTCWQFVTQPCIKGIWVHRNDTSGRTDEGCRNLVPVLDKELDRNKRWHCNHEFRRTEDLTNSLKCIHCGYPLRIGLIEYEYYSTAKFYCFDCKQEFKLMKVHVKKHDTGFEFKVIEE